MITFPRIYKPCCTVVLAGQTVQHLALPQVATPQGPRITFSVERTMTSTPDTAKVAIYGLAPERRTAMAAVFHELGQSEIVLSVGYDGITVPLFRGDVRRMKANERVDADYAVLVEADEAGDALATVTVRSSTLGLTASQMIDVALLALAQGGAVAGAGVRPQIVVKHPSVDAALATAPSAAVVYTSVSISKATDFLDEAARIAQARWFIRDGQLFFAKRRIPTDGLAVRLPRTHWLSEPSEDGRALMHLETFCDPNIAPGRLIALEGRTAPGVLEYFRAEACSYAGDTEASTPWSVSVVLRRTEGVV